MNIKEKFNNKFWIFFDVGSTLIDESVAYNHRIQDMIAGTGLSLEEIYKKRLEFSQQGLDGNSEIILYYGLKKTPWHSDDERPYSDAQKVLEHLKNRGYKLGIIANQISGLVDRLNNWGMASYFSVIASSSDLGVSKPNYEIFEKALSMAGCKACNSVMIGDRLDNDIIPAKRCGMQTIWVKNGLASCQPRELGNGYADMIIESLTELINIFI